MRFLVQCPHCHIGYDITPGRKHCSCGAEFTVDESGNVTLISTPPSSSLETPSDVPPNAPSTGGRSLSGLSRNSLKRLYFSSLFLLQWGWLGVLAIIYLSFKFMTLYKTAGWLLPVGIIEIVISVYIILKCRSNLARKYLFVCSLEFLIGWAIAVVIVASQSQWKHELAPLLICIALVSILPLFIGINLLLATKRDLLWGENRVTHGQIKNALKIDRFEDNNLSYAKRAADSPMEKIVVTIAFAWLIIWWLVLLGSIIF